MQAATRAAVLVITLISALIAGLLAAREGAFRTRHGVQPVEAGLIYLVLAGFFTPLMLVVFLSLYGFFKLVVPVYRGSRPAEYSADVWPLWFVAFAFPQNRRFGLLLALGLVAEVAFRLATG